MTKLALGLMSGTSADGLTISAVEVSPFRVVHFKNYRYPAALQQQILRAHQASAPQISALHYELGSLYAKLVHRFLREFNISPTRLSVIGSHGQTILHAPHASQPHTLQLAEPSFMATQFNVPVVSDFRAKDVSLGGEGAPLIPFFDEYLWGKGKPKILLNVGGIANLSLVGKGIKTMGFDVGPGNALMDACAQHKLHRPFDKNGACAAKGTPDQARVTRVLKMSFFQQKPPKSLDRAAFDYAYITRHFGSFSSQHTPDLLATLTYFTAAAVADQISRFIPRKYQHELIVSGGGAFNKTLLNDLQTLLPHVRVLTLADYGIDPQAKESAAFALFAWLALQGKINHCPRATGAKRASILGKITL